MSGAKRKRMYAVSADEIGLIAGTLAYSRRAAITCFLDHPYAPEDWEAFKRSGYRTVEAAVEITGKYGTRRTTKRR